MSSKYKNLSFTKNIKILHQQNIKIFLSKHDGVDGPLGITFNNDFTKLFIINREGKTVLVYSCK
jgi:hypothetical protein